MILAAHHAAERYIERVALVTHDEAIAALSSPAIERAAAFGAPYVKLAGKQRVVLEGSTVVTVLPSDCPRRPERKRSRTGASHEIPPQTHRRSPSQGINETRSNLPRKQAQTVRYSP